MPVAPTYLGKNVEVTGYFVNLTRGRAMLSELLNISNNGSSGTTQLLRGGIDKIGDVLKYILNTTGLIDGVLYATKIINLPETSHITISELYVPNQKPVTQVNVSIEVRNSGTWSFIDLVIVYIESPNGTVRYNKKLLKHLRAYWTEDFSIQISNLPSEEGNYTVHAYVLSPLRDFATASASAITTFEMDNRFSDPVPTIVQNGTHLADWLQQGESKYYNAMVPAWWLLTVTVKPGVGGDVDAYLYYWDNASASWVEYDSSTRANDEVDIVSIRAASSNLEILIEIYGYTTSGYSMYVDIVDFSQNNEMTFESSGTNTNPYITPRANGFKTIYEHDTLTAPEKVWFRNFQMDFTYTSAYSIYDAPSLYKINGVGFTRTANGDPVYVYGLDNWTSWYIQYDGGDNISATGQFQKSGDYPSIAYDTQTNLYYLAYRTPQNQIHLSRYDTSYNFIDDIQISFDDNQTYLEPDIRIVGNDVYVVYSSYNSTLSAYDIEMAVVNSTTLVVENYYFGLNGSNRPDPSLWYIQNNFFLGFIVNYTGSSHSIVFIARFDENWSFTQIIPVTDDLSWEQDYQYTILLDSWLIVVYNDWGDLRLRYTYFPIHNFPDNIPPTITHTPPSAAFLGEFVTLNFTVTDNINVQNVSIYYRLPGWYDFIEQEMNNSGGNSWQITLPQIQDFGTFEYYAVAVDQNGNINQSQIYIIDVNTTVSEYRPIRINNNAEFTFANGVFSGIGTEYNPYVISGLNINGSGMGYGIYIGNTTAYFIVRNNNIHHASGIDSWPYYYDSGITLYNVTNGRIENNMVTGNARHGIYLISSTNVDVINNTVSNNSNRGIHIYASNRNNITSNIVTGNTWDGIGAYSSGENNITNNEITGNSENGIWLYNSGGLIYFFDNLELGENNWISSGTNNMWQIGRPTSGPGTAYSSINVIGTNLAGDYPNNMNASIRTIRNISLTGVTSATLSFYHWFNSEPNFDYGYVEISTNGGNSWTQVGDSYTGNLGGWYIQTRDLTPYIGSNILLRFRFTSDGSVVYPGWYIDDIRLYGLGCISCGDLIINNTISNNRFGIYLNSSSSFNIGYNSITNNTLYGVYITSSSTGNLIHHNNFVNNNGGGIQAWDDTDSNFWNDTSEGNYWSDYSPTCQDTNPPYGICDYPYILDGSSGARDYFPLTNQVTVSEFHNSLVVVAINLIIIAVSIVSKRKK